MSNGIGIFLVASRNTLWLKTWYKKVLKHIFYKFSSFYLKLNIFKELLEKRVSNRLFQFFIFILAQIFHKLWTYNGPETLKWNYQNQWPSYTAYTANQFYLVTCLDTLLVGM